MTMSMTRIFTLSTNPPECRIDENRIALIRPSVDLFDSVARQIAEEIARPEVIERKWNNKLKRDEWVVKSLKNANKSTQLRKFYDEICMWEEKSRTHESFERNLPFIKMLNAKAAYAKGREHVDDKFVAFVAACLNQIKSSDAEALKVFKNLKTLFEAFMGFYKAIER